MVLTPLARFARSTLLRRALLSFALGLTFTFLPIIGSLIFINLESPNPIYMTVLGHFLYWPLSALEVAGINCVDADKVVSTTACVRIALLIDLFTYSAICFAGLWWAKRIQTEVQ